MLEERLRPLTVREQERIQRACESHAAPPLIELLRTQRLVIPGVFLLALLAYPLARVLGLPLVAVAAAFAVLAPLVNIYDALRAAQRAQRPYKDILADGMAIELHVTASRVILVPSPEELLWDDDEVPSQEGDLPAPLPEHMRSYLFDLGSGELGCFRLNRTLPSEATVEGPWPNSDFTIVRTRVHAVLLRISLNGTALDTESASVFPDCAWPWTPLPERFAGSFTDLAASVKSLSNNTRP